jgi:methylated-DNA-[protein]-cysteine S-methyltransferase
MSERTRFLFDTMDTPIGTAVLIVDERGALRMHRWEDSVETWRAEFQRRYGETDLVPQRDPFGYAATLQRYFDGDIAAIDTIRVTFTGTPFQTKVWSALRAIPGGTTLSYGALAARIGAPKAARAVGLANGANPIALVVPCHRIIGSDGALTGYGGGLPRKRWLLGHEQGRASSFCCLGRSSAQTLPPAGRTR